MGRAKEWAGYCEYAFKWQFATEKLLIKFQIINFTWVTWFIAYLVISDTSDISVCLHDKTKIIFVDMHVLC